MNDEIFEGYQIGEKKFPFIRVTVAGQAKVVKRFRTTFRDLFSKTLFPHSANIRMWKRLRSVAFVKNPLWKYLRIIPKELRCSEMNLKTAGELQARFFVIVGEIVKGHDAPLLSLNPSQTANKEAKPED
jgi:hypothetical protein